MCQKREIGRQHKNVAATGIFSMLALRPKRGGEEGEKREKKEGRKRFSFIFILKRQKESQDGNGGDARIEQTVVSFKSRLYINYRRMYHNIKPTLSPKAAGIQDESIRLNSTRQGLYNIM